VERITDFEKAYALGVTASKASPPNYPLAIVAFSKAYRLDPRRKVKPGRKPDPGLFEVLTRLAAAYRLNGQLYEAQKMYEWVLEHHDNRFARVGLAAVHEDNGEHVKALGLYKLVLNQHPDNVYALRGVAKTLANLGRSEEAREAYEKARRASSG
jgi:tetratricopeptide (TPR) repeat protein